jgi:hypothetical protein
VNRLRLFGLRERLSKVWLLVACPPGATPNFCGTGSSSSRAPSREKRRMEGSVSEEASRSPPRVSVRPLAVEVGGRERLAARVLKDRYVQDLRGAERPALRRQAEGVEPRLRAGGRAVVDEAVVDAPASVVGEAGEAADDRALEGLLVQGVREPEEVHAGGALRRFGLRRDGHRAPRPTNVAAQRASRAVSVVIRRRR